LVKPCLAFQSLGRRALLQSLLVSGAGLMSARHAMASDDPARSLAVVYPDIGEPFRSVFAAIIEGVEDRVKGRVASFALGVAGNPQDVLNELRRREIRAVIALGRNGLKLAASLDRQVSVVAAGVLSVPEGEAQAFPVYSLAPDPALLFARLRALNPAVKKVMVVYDPRQNAWLIKLARDAAKGAGVELQTYEAEDLRTAVRAYQEALASADPRRDALWLPQDSTTVEDSAVLPLVLRQAWNQSLTVFSSSVTHVKRGVLFALYPNNTELGRVLAGVALAQLGASAGTPRGVLALRDVLLAVNTRTANHLGLSLEASPLRFSLVYPEP